MREQIQVIFENGVFKPLTPVPPSVKDRQELTVTIEDANGSADKLADGKFQVSLEEAQWAGWVRKLDAFGRLENGWDSYRAPAPSTLAIQKAKALVLEAKKRQSVLERVEPSAMGGVGVTFAAGNREVVVEFYNNGTAHVLYADDVTGDMRTEPVSTDPAGYRELIDKAQEYLQ
jgi:predicted DNA-binding antitoxin AbrB/MazE fold protein